MRVNPFRVIIADDHALVRAGFRSLLENMVDVQVVAEAGTGQETLTLVKQLQPDIVLLDISMPGLNGLDVAVRLKDLYPDIKVLILSMHLNPEYVRRAFKAGAIGYLVKDAGDAELELAIMAVLMNEPYLSPSVAKQVIDGYAKSSASESEMSEILTPRQREILQLLAEGQTTKKIASLLHVSVKTVEAHRSQIMERLKIFDVPGLIRYSIRTGLVSLEC